MLTRLHSTEKYARVFFAFLLCACLVRAVRTTRDGGVTWVGAVDRVGERALIRLFCLGVHSPAHYQAYCPSHCYPYHDVSLFCNFPHLTDTTASPSTPYPHPIFLPILSLWASLFPRSARVITFRSLFIDDTEKDINVSFNVSHKILSHEDNRVFSKDLSLLLHNYFWYYARKIFAHLKYNNFS